MDRVRAAEILREEPQNMGGATERGRSQAFYRPEKLQTRDIPALAFFEPSEMQSVGYLRVTQKQREVRKSFLF